MIVCKKRSYFLLFICVLLICCQNIYGQKLTVLTGYAEKLKNTDSITITLDDGGNADYHKDRIKVPLTDGRFFFKKTLTHPAMVVTPFNSGGYSYIMEPGDSINIFIDENNSLAFSGRGSLKFRIIEDAKIINDSVRLPPNPYFTSCDSIGDYLAMCHWVDTVQIKRLAFLETYKDSISSNAFLLMQAALITQAESYRLRKMQSLMAAVHFFKTIKVSKEELGDLYDSTVERSAFRNIIARHDDISAGWYATELALMYLPTKNWRDNNFSETSFEAIGDEYKEAGMLFNGLLREKIISLRLKFWLGNRAIGDRFVDLQNCVKDYLSKSDYPEYKSWINGIYEKAVKVAKGNRAPGFSLYDHNGELVSLEDLKGKVILLDFWFTGCGPCAGLVPVMSKIENAFNNNPDVKLVNVSVDEDLGKWKKSLIERKYTTGSGICLNIGKTSTVNDYNVHSFPSVFLIDKGGYIVSISPPDARPSNNGEEMIEQINKLLKPAEHHH
ncbi:AhpC/TSA family protein [Chitinophaga agrisoli]|uniref:AhpC/TSA family protein n=1 Tax=Chitinophaga agrisoli TaxID=2607653 RepID=A0A5B2VQ11_9BACT|nr:TlpA disulfide reductase family protein [Chitinophaga agrisoli]KAA2240179.1 AhpC/TSA family protein [Chitinophaga agrisoli]